MTNTIFVSGLFHETHTFLRDKTELAHFKEVSLYHGQEILEHNQDNSSPMDGFLSYAREKKWQVIPGVQLAAMPSGTVKEDVITYFRKHFFSSLEKVCDSIDAVYLVLHGAMVSENTPDVEGSLLEELHHFLQRKGRDIPVVAVLDLHANVSQKMMDYSTCMYAYRKNPHTDARDAAIRAAQLLDHILTHPDVRKVYHQSRHIIPPTGLGTAAEPMKSLLMHAAAIEASDPDVLCINVMGGYAYADIPDCGFSLGCYTKGDTEKARIYLAELMALLEENLISAYPPENSLEEVWTILRNEPDVTAPVLLIEASDNIGGGTPGDGTGILAPLLATGRKGIIAVINDAVAVQQCYGVGIGKEITLAVGAKTDHFHGDPVQLQGSIRHLSDGRFELENKNSHLASISGAYVNMGSCAVIENEQAIVLLTSHKTPPMDIGQLRSQGIQPEAAAFIIVKAAVSHKQAYDPIAKRSFYIDSPGLCTSYLERLPYQHIGDKQVSLTTQKGINA
ncbi:M81 family metallopeptidase [Chitinophaga sp. MM2321]|uniref:M81 family metallopeptidase n=1 Tax=Chitinophaga sp. MM2321 TaxID=3137178 RepID=UPI0032D57168